jgi:hypothetical protein
MYQRSWIFQAPTVDLLDEQRKVIGSHNDSPRQQLNDGSLVEGEVISKQVSLEATSVPWLSIESA